MAVRPRDGSLFMFLTALPSLRKKAAFLTAGATSILQQYHMLICSTKSFNLILIPSFSPFTFQTNGQMLEPTNLLCVFNYYFFKVSTFLGRPSKKISFNNIFFFFFTESVITSFSSLPHFGLFLFFFLFSDLSLVVSINETKSFSFHNTYKLP